MTQLFCGKYLHKAGEWGVTLGKGVNRPDGKQNKTEGKSLGSHRLRKIEGRICNYEGLRT